MFDKFNVPAFYIETDATLALFASARNTGIVVSFGYEICQIVPIDNGWTKHNEVIELQIGAKHIKDEFERLLKKNRGYSFWDRDEILDDIVKTMIYIADNYDDELTQNRKWKYEPKYGNYGT